MKNVNILGTEYSIDIDDTLEKLIVMDFVKNTTKKLQLEM